jgi:hypothetical protein
MSEPIDVDFEETPARRKCLCPCCENAADAGEWCSYCVGVCLPAIAQAHRSGVSPSVADAARDVARYDAIARVGAPIARRATSAVIDALLPRRPRSRRK